MRVSQSHPASLMFRVRHLAGASSFEWFVVYQFFRLVRPGFFYISGPFWPVEIPAKKVHAFSAFTLGPVVRKLANVNSWD